MNDKIKTYKGVNKDLTAYGGFKYVPGKEYECAGKIVACCNGFHACERPLDVLIYYAPATSRYFEAEQSGELSRDDSDSKVASGKIKIGAEIGIPGLVKAHIEYVKAHTTAEYTDPDQATAGAFGAATAGAFGAATAGAFGAATAGDSGAATAGDRGAATAGDRGAATAGAFGAATAGYSGAATAGDRGAATAGDRGAATAGDSGAATAGAFGAATAGYRGAATAGDRGAATAGYSGAATAGDRGAATAGDSGAATAGAFGAATAGYRGAATAGAFGAATAGAFGAATAGYSGAATAGAFGAATSRGLVSVGKNGCGLVRGSGIKARGGIGSILVFCVENQDDFGIKDWKVVEVDGETIKADTWYTLKDGLLVEVEE